MAALAEAVNVQSVIFAGLQLPLAIRLSEPFSDDQLRAFAAKIEPCRVERNADGELEIMTPLVSRGGRRESYVIGRLELWTENNGGESFSSSSGFALPDGSMRCADSAWVSERSWGSLTDEEQDSFAPLCPEFVIEIVSKSDSMDKVKRKMTMWMSNGTQLAWMIDPFAAELTIYRPSAAPETLSRPDWVEATSVVPGFRLETSRLWAK